MPLTDTYLVNHTEAFDTLTGVASRCVDTSRVQLTLPIASLALVNVWCRREQRKDQSHLSIKMFFLRPVNQNVFPLTCQSKCFPLTCQSKCFS